MAETDLGPEDAAATTTAAASAGPGSAPPAHARRLPGPGWLVIGVPAVTSFLAGGYEIGGPSLWRDEAYTKDAITRSVSQIFALLGHQDAVHGAYYVLMHVVVSVTGTSAAALRFPSLCAMVIATAFTAAIGRRAAALALPPDACRDGVLGVPALTGLLSGLVFATAPYMTYYAQTARSYAIVTMFATTASYLLLRAYPDGRWRWWLGYGAAVALAGLFNLFGLLILAAHGVTLLLTGARGLPAAGRPARVPVGIPAHAVSRGPGRAPSGSPGSAAAGRWIGLVPLRWLAASAAALIVLGPLLRVASRQQKQISWLTRPDVKTIEQLFTHFAGSEELVLPVALLALAGVAASRLADEWRPLNPAAIALPWLVVPPFLLIAASFLKPVYIERYVEFCLPALAILVGTGIVGLVRLVAGSPLGGRLPWLPFPAAVLVIAALAVMLAGPQAAIRQTAARPDNLRLASAIVAANEQPGDVIFYVPVEMHVLGTGYPAPFLRLRDIALAESPIASATLTGTEITSPALLKSRFTGVRRVWVVTGSNNDMFPVPTAPVDKEKMALLAGMHIVHRWTAGEVMLTLYGS